MPAGMLLSIPAGDREASIPLFVGAELFTGVCIFAPARCGLSPGASSTGGHNAEAQESCRCDITRSVLTLGGNLV